MEKEPTKETVGTASQKFLLTCLANAPLTHDQRYRIAKRLDPESVRKYDEHVSAMLEEGRQKRNARQTTRRLPGA